MVSICRRPMRRTASRISALAAGRSGARSRPWAASITRRAVRIEILSVAPSGPFFIDETCDHHPPDGRLPVGPSSALRDLDEVAASIVEHCDGYRAPLGWRHGKHD